MCGRTPGVDSTLEDHAACIAVYTALACADDSGDIVIAGAPILTFGAVPSTPLLVDAGRAAAPTPWARDEAEAIALDKIPI